MIDALAAELASFNLTDAAYLLKILRLELLIQLHDILPKESLAPSSAADPGGKVIQFFPQGTPAGK